MAALWWLLGLVFVSLSVSVSVAQAQTVAQTLPLNAEETAWIAQHPLVPVVVLDGNSPYYSRRADGTAVGFAADMMALVSERTGLRWDYQWVPSTTELVKAVKDGAAAMTPLAAPSTDREPYATFPGALLPAEMVLVTRSDVPDTSDSGNFAGRRVAVVESAVPGELLRREYPGAKIIVFKSLQDALRAVSVGEADLSVAWLHEALYHIEAGLLANLRVQREERAGRSFLGPAVSRREPVLSRIVAKALESITPAERAASARRWLPSGEATLWAPGNAKLSEAERDWVKRAGEVRIGFDRQFAPFTLGGSLGRFEGLGADMFRLAAQKVGLRVIEQTGASFADTYDRATRDELDVVVAMARTEVRRTLFDFVGPFSSSPTVMVMRSDDLRPWHTPDDIVGAPLGLLKSHFLIPEISSRHPGLVLSTFDTQHAALNALSEGKVAAVIGNVAVIDDLIKERFAGGLRMVGVLPNADSELYFGVPKSKPELTRLLAKGFAAITPSEAAAIRQRWLFVTVQPGLTWADVLRWAAPVGLSALLIMAFMWQSNRRLALARRVADGARQDAEQATRAHQRAEALLDDVAAHVPGVVFRYVVGAEGGMLHRYVSPGAKRFLGVDELDSSQSILKEMIGRVREDQREAALEAERTSLHTGQPFKITVAYNNPEVGLQWLHGEALQRPQSDGTCVWTGYIVDVSVERQLQDRLAREAESRNLLMASASHELRAPTHTLALALQSVTGQGLAEGEVEALDIARRSAQTLTQLLNDVLDAARFSTDVIKLRPRSFDLHALMAEVSGAWRAAASSKGLTFDLQLAADLPRRVVLDPLRLKQILTNLLSNACKFTAAGRISLNVGREADGSLCFVVGDTGQGIDTPLQARLFEPYVTAAGTGDREPVPEGSTGLGLSICRKLAQLMGGTIALHSKLGEGSEFTLRVPLVERRTRAHTAQRHGTVLICDDDPVSRVILTEMLNRLGFSTEAVADASAALARWRQGGLAALITDIDMPGLSGLDLMGQIRASEGREGDAAVSTALIVCSGSEAPIGADEGWCDAYLQKPAHVDLLAQTLRDLGIEPGAQALAVLDGGRP